MGNEFEYKELYTSESHGQYGSFGIKILVAANKLPDLDAQPIWFAVHEAVRLVSCCCGWRSQFDPEFIAEYKAKLNK